MSLMQMTTFLYTSPKWSPNIITQTSQNGTTSPNIINIYYRRTIMMWVYSAAELQSATGKTSGTIKGLRFYVIGQPAYQPLPEYAIGMKNGSFGTSAPGNTGYTVVKSPSSESFTTSTTKEFVLTDFSWTGQDLAIIFAWGQCPTGYSASGIVGTGAGSMWYTWQDGPGSYVINTDDPINLMTYRPVVQLYL